MNLTVQTPNEWLAAVDKPTLETIRRVLLNPEDWFVMCAGFEDRALGALQVAVGQSPFNLLLIHYEPYIPENKTGVIRDICKSEHIKVTDIIYNRQEPSGIGDIFLKQLSGCRGRIFIDVSAMSRLLIVQLLVALGTRPDRFANCFIIYAEAKIYPPNQTEVESKLAKSESDPTFSILFLSAGVFGVTVVPELSSFAPAGTQTRLIAFPSLDAHQLIALRVEIQPSQFSFIEGIPPSPHNKWRQQAIARVNQLDQIQKTNKYLVSTLNYQETLDCLLSIYSKHSERERLIISPTGSKMQTIAVGLFRALIEDVQIVYPTPSSFCKPDAYTLGVGPIHALSLSPFSYISSEEVES